MQRCPFGPALMASPATEMHARGSFYINERCRRVRIFSSLSPLLFFASPRLCGSLTALSQPLRLAADRGCAGVVLTSVTSGCLPCVCVCIWGSGRCGLPAPGQLNTRARDSSDLSSIWVLLLRRSSHLCYLVDPCPGLGLRAPSPAQQRCCCGYGC